MRGLRRYRKRAVVETFENLLYGYVQHREAKSLGLDGQSCKGNANGLLGRAHIIAGKFGLVQRLGPSMPALASSTMIALWADTSIVLEDY